MYLRKLVQGMEVAKEEVAKGPREGGHSRQRAAASSKQEGTKHQWWLW